MSFYRGTEIFFCESKAEKRIIDVMQLGWEKISYLQYVSRKAGFQEQNTSDIRIYL